PINIAVHAVGTARALMLDQAALVDRENLRMLFGQPDGRSGCGSAQHDFNARFAHDVHGPAQPAKVVLPLLPLANSPGKLAHTDDVDPGGEHQVGIALPSGFGLLSTAVVRKDPMFGIVISSEIHRLIGWVHRHSKMAMEMRNSKTRLFAALSGSF